MSPGAVHALLLLCVGGLALAIPIWQRRPATHSWRLVMYCVIPSLTVGALSGLILNAGGTPFLEWLLPAAAALSTSLFLKERRAAIGFAAAMFLAAVLLSLNFLVLVAGPYTASPASVQRRADVTDRTIATERQWHSFFPRLHAVEGGR